MLEPESPQIILSFVKRFDNSQNIACGFTGLELFIDLASNTSTIEFTQDYFNSLMEHSIPLDERALRALANTPIELDIYAWLAQRIHRIKPEQSQFVAWTNTKEHFGKEVNRMDHLKTYFRKNLCLVKEQYQDAQIEEIANKGFTLKNSPPPIKPKSTSINGLKELLT